VNGFGWPSFRNQSAPKPSRALPTKVFEADDWKIEIGLMGGFKKDVEVERAIGGAMGDVGL
jgi:hypothetical protein